MMMPTASEALGDLHQALTASLIDQVLLCTASGEVLEQSGLPRDDLDSSALLSGWQGGEEPVTFAGGGLWCQKIRAYGRDLGWLVWVSRRPIDSTAVAAATRMQRIVQRLCTQDYELENLSSELGFSNTQYGLFVSFYAIPNTFLLMAVLGGMILDKLGIRRTGFTFIFFMALLIKLNSFFSSILSVNLSRFLL